MPANSEPSTRLSGNSALTLGVEEEFHLVDLKTRRLTPRAADVLSGLASCSGNYAAELQQTVVETNSAVVDSLDALRHSLTQLRATLIATAQPLGVGVASAGTMPLSMPLAITETPRFRRMLADYQLLVREQLICGMQVHVGIPDRSIAAQLCDRVSAWLPPLLALSVSSPFAHSGVDTGYASSRSLIWWRWPTSGSAGPVESAAEYDALVQNLVASGVISDPGMIYFDVRPSAHVPTIELRVCDACPNVDTVVLIAGLFRAVVARELARLHAGEPSRAVVPALLRAAMWRAARSGLEGELVDLAVPRSVPAGVLLRGILEELRPELTSSGDFDAIQKLLEAALVDGSAAARQREALLRRERITDVVDSIIAETRGERLAPFDPAQQPAILRGYAGNGFDEAVLPTGRARMTHSGVLDTLCKLERGGLRARALALENEKEKAGVSFRISGQQAARAFPVDLVPRVLTGEEWSRLQGGTAQRARALDAFLRDIYTERAIVRDGVLPEWLVQRAPGHHPAGRIFAGQARRTHVSGFDIVRDGDGRWLVLEDNVRVPSGVAFAVQNRRLMRAVVPELLSGVELLDPEVAPGLLLKMLQESMPLKAARSEQPIVLLSEGPTDSAFFEHRFLAESMGVPLCLPRELTLRGERIVRHTPGGDVPVDVIYLRLEDPFVHAAGSGRRLGPELVRAVENGTLTLANALGNGIADDKAIYAYVPQFIEYYLHEHPLIEQVPTYHCADPEQRQLVLARIHELVIKPVDGYGGLGVVIGPHASESELESARNLIREQPARWIAQETVALSSHPCFDGHRLTPRHIDLRVFVYLGEDAVVVPAALTRVAPAGSLVVNSSRGGGAKDTWVLQ
jgi:carboxylate-amine ligase